MGRVGGRIFNGYRKNLNPFNFLVGVRQGYGRGLIVVWFGFGRGLVGVWWGFGRGFGRVS